MRRRSGTTNSACLATAPSCPFVTARALWSAVARFNYFGTAGTIPRRTKTSPATGWPTCRWATGLAEDVRATLGADNVLDAYPELNPNRFTGLGNKYSQYAPAGFNGRYMWLRVTVTTSPPLP